MTHFSHIHGVILQILAIKDHDVLLYIFSKEKGKTTVYAKGVKKNNSKLGAFLQRGMIGKFELIQTKSAIPQLKTIESIFLPECENYEMLTKFHQSLELCYRLCQENQVLDAVFSIMTDFIPLSCHSYSPLLYQGFILKILTALGFLGDLKICAHCQKKCSEIDHFFSAEKGTICSVCANSLLPSLPFMVLKILAFLQQASFQDIQKLNISEQEKTVVETFVSLLKNTHLEKPLRSES